MTMTESALMCELEARTITDQIKVDVEAVWELIKRAYTQLAWAALGYSSWDEYCAGEFGTCRLRLPREERTEVVSSLRESGLSLRAIASATGLGRGTVARKLAPVPNGTPADHADPITASSLEALEAAIDRAHGDNAEIAPVIGMDGKRYQPKPSPPKPVPKQRPTYRDEFYRAVFDLERLVDRFARLAIDDRFTLNRVGLNNACLRDLKKLLVEVTFWLEGGVDLDEPDVGAETRPGAS